MYILYGILILLMIGAVVVFFEGTTAPDGMVEFGGQMRHWEDLLQENFQLQLSVVVLILVFKVFEWFGTVPEGTPFTKKFLLYFGFGGSVANISNALFAIKGGLWEMQEAFGFSMLGIYWLAVWVLAALVLGLTVYDERKKIWDAAKNTE